MILKDLNIRGFGKFHDRKIEFSDGINILYGGNEAGKSTLHAFLRAMFYGMERARGRAARTDFYAHYGRETSSVFSHPAGSLPPPSPPPRLYINYALLTVS